MANILEQYIAKQKELNSQIQSSNLSPSALADYQELVYRIGVLEAFKAFSRTAPVTLDTKAMGRHFQIADSNIRALLTERQIGPRPDEEGKKKRETAHTALKRVVEDGHKRFGNFKASTQEEYKKCIGNLINTVLPVWIQYRNTYVNI